MLVRYRILGALRVHDEQGRLCTFDRRQSRIMAVLLLSANQAVGRDYLVEAVWDEAPPATAGRQLQNCISQLRQQHVIVAEPSGYRLRLDPESLDAEVFDGLLSRARAEPADEAILTLRSGLALWTGPALAGMTGRLLDAATSRLNEQRLAAWETLLELELQQGSYSAVVADLLELVAAHPLRENLVGLLMRALHASGRQSESLQAYDTLRKRLAEELGLDPSPTLQDLHSQLLRGSTSTTAPVPALRQLPAPVRHFVGRSSALDSLDTLASQAGGDAVVISVIHGTGGIGKTALAVRWAHRAASRFPDGQLFVNLRGFDPTREPLTPGEAVRGFLDAFGVPPEQIPVSVEAQVSLYRTMVASRRLLVVLDNARDVDQVRPLLPGSSGCMVVVTSRHLLTGLVAVEGAHPLTLDLLSPDEARSLLVGHLGTARVSADPVATGELVSHCALLPLALAIIAARAAAHPTFPLATFSAELADAQRRLDAVDGGDSFTQVRSVFSWSYQRLSSQAARMFRLLGLARGADISVPAASHLAGLPPPQARQLLSDLARAHMVTQHASGRFSFHDLLSAYAMEQAISQDPPTDRLHAVERLVDFYLHSAAAADALVTPLRRRIPLPSSPSDVPHFHDHADAFSWLESERANLVAAVRLACSYDLHLVGSQLANVLFGLFHLGKHWDDWIGTHILGLDCARSCGDLRAEFTFLSSLGLAHRELRHFEEAYEYHAEALAIARKSSDRYGEGQALNGIGAVYADMGNDPEAQEHFAESLAIRREVGDRWGEAITICNMGEGDLEAGRLSLARANFLAALEIRREIGDRLGEATALSYIGQSSSDPVEAVACLEQALALHRELHDPAMEARDLHQLGLVYESMGHRKEAKRYFHESTVIYERLRMPA